MDRAEDSSLIAYTNAPERPGAALAFLLDKGFGSAVALSETAL